MVGEATITKQEKMVTDIRIYKNGSLQTTVAVNTRPRKQVALDVWRSELPWYIKGEVCAFLLNKTRVKKFGEYSWEIEESVLQATPMMLK